MDTTPSTTISWLNYPCVPLRFIFLKSHKMSMELTIFIWKNVCVRYEVIFFPSEFLLCFDIVETEAIFSSDLIAHRKVVDSLKFI